MIYKPLLKKENKKPEYVPGTEIVSGLETLLEDPSDLMQSDPLLLKEDVVDPALGSDIEDKKSSKKTNYDPIKFSSPDEFKSYMMSTYKKILKEKGMDISFAKALVAQDALESAWGSKPSGTYNFGGIKGSGTTKSTKEYINGQYITTNDNFKDFNSIEDYARYKVNLLNNPRYNVFAHPVNEFAFWVKNGGYATSPVYTETLNRVINSFKQGGIIDYRWPWLKNNYFKNGGILRFSSGGTGPGLDKALSDQVSFSTGSFGSNITRWSLDKLNRDYSYDIYRPHLEKIVDIYGDSLFVNNNSLSKREKIDFLYSLRGELSSLDIPKEYKRDLSSLTKYFKNYIDSHTIGYKKETKLPDGSISTAYFDKNKKYLRREGARPKDLNEGIITINVDNDASKLNPHALAELYARYHGIPIARNGMKIKQCQSGGLTSETRKWINHLNGASHYDRVTNGRHYVPFYDRLRTGSPVTLDDGTAYDIVLGDYNGKPIIYSNIMLEDSSIKDDKVIGSSLKDYRNDPDAAYQRAIETRNYITAPSVEVAKNFIDNYQTLGHWYPDFNESVAVDSSPTTKKNVVTKPNDGIFSFIKNLMVPSYIYPTTQTFDINQIAGDNTKYDVIVSNRVKMVEDALRRAGYTNQSDIDRLAYFLAAQSIRETGWVDVDPKNNYGGYIVNGVKLRYNSPEEFWDAHINNLNDKYFGWDKAKNINEYLNILNDPDWYMLDEAAIKAEQNRREKLGKTLYLYAPRYANNGKDYTKEVMDIIDRFTYYYNY